MATKLASEWVFWKTGKVDTFLFPMLVKEMVWTIMVGCAIIIVIPIFFSLLKRQRNKMKKSL
jgi:hypothetical protein